MNVFSQSINAENFTKDLEFLQSALKKNTTRKIIYIIIEKTDSFFRAKKELAIVKKTEPENSIVILITEFPGPKWIKKFPRLTDNFIDFHFST